MVIKRVGPLSCAKIAGTLYAVMGLFVGAVLSVAVAAGVFAGGDANAPALPRTFGAAAVVVLPILYGCLGFVAAFIGAALYNALAGAIGGIELDIE